MATARNVTVSSPPPLVLDITTSAQQRSQWTQWRDNLDLYFTCSNITDTAQKRALLLYLGGEEIRKLNSTFIVDESDTYEKLLALLNKHFETKVCLSYERNAFRKVTPQPAETAKSYVTRLKQAASSCEFEKYNVDAAIIDQFIEHTDRPNLRRRLMKTSELTLVKLIEMASEEENVEAQANTMENHQESLNKLQISVKPNNKYKNMKPFNENSNATNFKPIKNSNFTCNGCGNKGHMFGTSECPAFGQTCNYCKRENHFAKVCFRKKYQNTRNRQDNTKYQPSHRNQNNNLECYEEASDDEYLFQINAKPDVIVKIDDHPVKFLRDSGASVDIIDLNTYNEINEQKKIQLHNTATKIFTYGSKDPLSLEGMFYANVNYGTSHHLSRIYVTTAAKSGCILGRTTATSLGLIKLSENINAIEIENNEINQILRKHKKVFQGLGKLKNVQVKYDIDETVKPVTQPLRRIPFHLRKKVEEKIKELEELQVIEKVTESTSWVSPIVPVPKGNTVRITLDMRKANTAIKRKHYPIPTLEELLSKFNGCKFFSKIDLLHGYHQIEIHPESRYITTFATHTGVYRYKRMVQGVNSAFEDYQYHIGKLFENQERIQNICDDILVAGCTQEEHNQALETCLEILENNGLTVNSKKCIWSAPEVTFYGHVISGKGVRPTESKVQAIKSFVKPKNVKELASFLGLVNYLSGFINNLATITSPLRKLLQKDVRWQWTEDQEKAFVELKKIVSSNLCVAHFNVKYDTFLITDASPVGLGGILAQKQPNGSIKPVAYASKSLSKTEMKYSQTEREALGIVWCCERFHVYIYGSKFTILSDHQPLKILYSAQGKPSPRILRWGLRLQAYNYQIQHIPGCSNPADFLSIQPMKTEYSTYLEDTENHINAIIAYSTPKAVPLSQIIHESSNDIELSEVIKAIENDDWNVNKNAHLKEYFKVREELTYKSGILLRNEKIVIPSSLRQQILRIAHETHMGIVKTKNLLRDKVWWPGLSKQIEEMIKTCIPCLSMRTTKVEPMKHNNYPITKPWSKVHIDLCGPFGNEYVIGIIDSFSRWPDISIVTSTTSETIIKQLKKSFAIYGYPEEITTDNGRNLISAEITNFCEEYAIKHRKSTPYWPQANSEIERFYGTLMNFIKTVTAEGRNWKDEIYTFLLTYRNAPHCTTGVSPAEALMNRKLRDKLPVFTAHDSNLIKEIRQHDFEKKEKSKIYYDSKKNTKQADFQIGDYVLMKKQDPRKMDTKFDIQPVKVVEIKGNAITISKNNKKYTRNSSQFIKLPSLHYKTDENNTESYPEETDRNQNESRNIVENPIIDETPNPDADENQNENLNEPPNENENINADENPNPNGNPNLNENLNMKDGNIIPKRSENVRYKLNNSWKTGKVSFN